MKSLLVAAFLAVLTLSASADPANAESLKANSKSTRVEAVKASSTARSAKAAITVVDAGKLQEIDLGSLDSDELLEAVEIDSLETELISIGLR